MEQMKSNSELFNFTLNTSYTQSYRQQDCFDFCLQRVIELNCKCSHPKYPNLNKTLKHCISLNDLKCILEQKEHSIHAKDSNCYKDCPMECESITYDVQLSTSEYPTNEYNNFLAKNENNKSKLAHKRNQLALNIFYPYNKYTKITEYPKMTLYELFSNVGGSMGIFLGFTIFSLIDFLEVIVKVILALAYKE